MFAKSVFPRVAQDTHAFTTQWGRGLGEKAACEPCVTLAGGRGRWWRRQGVKLLQPQGVKWKDARRPEKEDASVTGKEQGVRGAAVGKGT